MFQQLNKKGNFVSDLKNDMAKNTTIQVIDN